MPLAGPWPSIDPRHDAMHPQTLPLAPQAEQVQTLCTIYLQGLEEGLLEIQDFGIHCCTTALLMPFLMQPVLEDLLTDEP